MQANDYLALSLNYLNYFCILNKNWFVVLIPINLLFSYSDSKCLFLSIKNLDNGRQQSLQIFKGA